MDPLSIIASSIAVVGAIKATLAVVKVLYHADSDFQALRREIEDTEAMLIELDHIVRQRHQLIASHIHAHTSLALLLTQTKTQLDLLHNTVNNRLRRVGVNHNQTKQNKFGWLIHRSSIKQIQVELRQSRERLCSLVDITSLSSTLLVHARLDDIAEISQQQAIELAVHTQTLDSIVNHFRTYQLHSTTQDALAVAEKTPRAMVPLSAKQPSFYHDTPGADRLQRYADSVDQGEGNQAYCATRSRAAHYRPSQCEGWCACACHLPWSIRSPDFFDKITGSLMLSLSGFPALKRVCSETTCRRQSIRTVRLNYFFPPWLLARVLQCALSICESTGPELILRVPRIVPDNAPLLFFAVAGNIDGIKDLFNKGLASPFDVAISNGRTALHYSVNYGHQELSQFLMDKGASSDVPDKNKASSVALAWERIFGRSCDTTTAVQSWRCMFDDEEYLESRCFPVFHKAVLGLGGVSLEGLLSTTTANINAQDVDGRTALSWAAARGDYDAVSTLLAYGADPNLRSLRGHHSLSWACQSSAKSRRRVIELLIKHGADVNNVDIYDRFPLINATSDADDAVCLAMLLDAGAHIDWEDCHKRSALVYAAKMGHAGNLAYLLDRGANIHSRDHWGHTALSEAVHQNRHSCLRVLLDRGQGSLAKHIKVSGGMTLLHLVAAFSDATTMDMLYDASSELELSTHALCDEQLTPADTFSKRKVLDDELVTAFERLLAAVSSRMDPTNEIDNFDDLVDSDVWELALEQQGGLDEADTILPLFQSQVRVTA